MFDAYPSQVYKDTVAKKSDITKTMLQVVFSSECDLLYMCINKTVVLCKLIINFTVLMT